jgi:WD40 repeat protein
MSLAFSPDGSRLVSGMITESRGGEPSDYVEYQGLLKMWDTTNDNLIWKRMLPDGDLTSVAFSPDGKLVATGLLGVLVKLYDAASSSRVRFFDDKQAVVSDLLLEAGEASVLSLAFSPDGKMLASGGSTGHLFVWDVQTGKQLAHLSEPHYDTSLEVVYRYGPEPPPRPGATRESIEALAFSADGKRLYSAGCEGAISVWETKDWKQTAAIAAAEGRCIRALAITNDGKWLVSAAEDGQIIFWNIITNKLVARLLVAADTNDWLIVAANGLYDGTEAAINSLAAWRIGNRLVSMTSLPPQFHVKGLLLKVLAEETPNSAMDLQQLLNSRE